MSIQSSTGINPIRSQYLYHHLPTEMRGSVVYPLNNLKAHFPDIYQKEAAKYQGREAVKAQRIPLFKDCLWNDVLFLISVHPQELYSARREAGWADLAPQTYLKIDPHSLDQTKLGVYLFPVHTSNDGSPITETDFRNYNVTELANYATIPKATKDYFKDEYDKGALRIELFYRYIPHVLYKGPIDISQAERITVY